MQEPGNDENVCRQVMEVSDQSTITQCGYDVQDPVVGHFMIRNVIEEECKTCHGKQNETGQADDAQAEGSEGCRVLSPNHAGMKVF